MATSKTATNISFTYDIEGLFNSVALRATYAAKSIKNEKGEAMLDDIAISQDEKDIIKEYFEEAVYEIAAELFKIADKTTVTQPVVINDTGYTITISNYDAYNSNLLPSLDKKIEKCLRHFALKEWFLSTGVQSLAQVNAEYYAVALMQMKNLTFQLRKVLMA